MDIVHNMMESNRPGVRNNLVGMSATSLVNNCFVIKFFRDWVDKPDETSSILSFKLSSDVSHEVSGGAGNITSFNRFELEGNQS